MKGKGKGDRSEMAEKSDIKESIIEISELAVIDHVQHCPRFTSVIGRSRDDSIIIEELDGLQLELESILSTVSRRMQQLHTELETLNSDGKLSIVRAVESNGKDVRTGAKGTGSQSSSCESSPAKRSSGKGQDEKPSKKQKLEDAPATPGKRGKGEKTEHTKKSKETPSKTLGKATPTRAAKGKPMLPPPSVEELTPPPPPAPPVPLAKIDAPLRVTKNDAPNRFWALVEPYCGEITSDDLKVLEDIMRSHEDDADFYKVPPLGKHYADKWAHEDMMEEQRQNSKLNDKRRNNSTGSSASNDEAAALVKKAKDSGGADGESPYGPLTQRLVQALIEENIMTPLNDACISDADAAEAATISPRSLAKQLNMGNPASLERKIKRELELEGILDGGGGGDSADGGDDDPGDEVLAELKRKQAELKAISQQNMSTTKRLHKLAKEEMARQDLRKRIIVADAEVMDAYRKIQQSRLKKKAYTKKEIDSVKRAIKERELLVKQMDSSY